MRNKSVVVRGPTWKWGSQDGVQGALGWLTSELVVGGGDWAKVTWHAGGSNNYRLNPNDFADVVPVLVDPTCSAASRILAETGGGLGPPPGSVSGGGDALSGFDTSVTYTPSSGGGPITLRYRVRRDLTTRDAVKTGTLVVRGPGWSWGDQDGKDGAVGVVVTDRPAGDGWVSVLWHANGHRNGYRMTSDTQDLNFVQLAPGSAATRLCREVPYSVPPECVGHRSKPRAPAAPGSSASAAPAPAAASAAEPAASGGLIDGIPADEAVAIVRAEKMSLEEELARQKMEMRMLLAAHESLQAEMERLRAAAAGAEAPAPAPPLAAAPSARVLGDCLICYEAVADVASAPCGHICCCEGCAGDLAECPVCRRPIESRLRVFPSGVDG